MVQSMEGGMLSNKRRSAASIFLHIRVQLELVRLESDSEVALGDLVPAGLKGHLVSGQPSFIPHHRCTVDRCPVDVVVDVAAKIDVVALVARRDLATLLAGRREKWWLSHSQSFI